MKRRSIVWRVLMFTAIAVTGHAIGACSSAPERSSFEGSSGTTTGSDPMTTGGYGLGGTPNFIMGGPPPSSDGGGDLQPGAVCTGEIKDGTRAPLDMYFLVDTSGSMNEQVQGGSKWQVVSQALVSFLKDPANADVGVGLGYFPNNAPATCTAGQPDCLCINLIITTLCFPQSGGSCTVADYASPSVTLSLPPEHAAAITNIGLRKPGGGTPTRPALEGAIQYASTWAQSSHRKTVVVLATDGDPTGCTQNSPQDTAAIAAAALAGPAAIQTFVMGVGRSLSSLNLVAQSGGTGQAILVDTGGDVGQAITDALKQIRGQALPCAYDIPARSSQGVVDPHKVNVRAAAKGASQTAVVPMTQNGDPSKCGAMGGWYYDNPAAPTVIQLCPSTCQGLMGGHVEVEFGCQTIEDVN